MITKRKMSVFALFLLFLTLVFAFENDPPMSLLPVEISGNNSELANGTANFTNLNETINEPVNETPTGDVIIELPVELPTNGTNESPTVIKLPVELPANESLIIDLPIEEPVQPIQEPTTLEIIIDKISSFIGEVINIQAFLKYENETPLPDKKIDFYADEYIGSDTTDIKGKAEIFWNTSLLLPGSYVISVEYAGDEEYGPTSMGTNIVIKGKPSVKNKFNVNDEKENVLDVKIKVGEDFVEELENKTYNLTLSPQEYPVTEIKFKNLQVQGDLNLGLSHPTISSPEELIFEDVYAINPEALDFESATVTSIAQATTLYKCKEWDFSSSQCAGIWEEVMNLVVGEEYSFILTKDDPGFAEGKEKGLLLVSTQEKTIDEYRTILGDVVNNGDNYALIQYENNSIQYEVLTPSGQDFILTRGRAKSTDIYEIDKLILNEYWTAYENISRDLRDQYGRTKNKVKFKPDANGYEGTTDNVSLTNNLSGIGQSSTLSLGVFFKSLTIQNNTYVYRVQLDGDFMVQNLLWRVYLPNLGLALEELNCKFTAGDFTFDVCENDMEFITRFDNELLFGFGKVGEHKEIIIYITKI